MILSPALPSGCGLLALVCVVVFGLFSLAVSLGARPDPFVVELVFLPCLACLLSAAASLLLQVARLGKRLRVPFALEKLKQDQRPPVLLLRAFQDDKVAVLNRSSRQPWWTKGWIVTETPSVTFEEVLCQLFSVCGPVIAIGRPGEFLAPLGASRCWVSDSRWRQVIDELIRESQLIVMIMGATWGEEGLAWEVRRIFQLDQIAKLVLVMPPVEQDVARERWEMFQRLCEGRLPPYKGGEMAAWFTSDDCASVQRGNGVADSDYRDALIIHH